MSTLIGAFTTKFVLACERTWRRLVDTMSHGKSKLERSPESLSGLC